VRFLVVFFLTALSSQVLKAQDLPEALRDASVLELQGHYAQALSAYENAMALGDQGGATWILSKVAFLALSLGQVQKAQDLAQTLTQSADTEAEQLGLLVQMRLLRQEQRSKEAVMRFRRWQTTHSRVPVLPSLVREYISNLPSAEKNSSQLLFLKVQPVGGEVLLSQDEAEILPFPQIPSTKNSSHTLQMGIFRNLENARQLVKNLSKIGWGPQIDSTVQAGFRLYRVSIATDRAEQDLEKLKIQGFDGFILSH
jgi:tetratricopeptide (TPR) repeat protein